MNTRILKLLVLAIISPLGLVQPARGDLVISSVNTASLIDFESTLTGVNNGAYTGAGFGAGSGQLDAGAWAITDLSGAELARGYTSGSGAAGVGLYSFDVLGGGTSHTFGVKPDNNDFNIGTVTLRVANMTGSTIGSWAISYDLFSFNNTNTSSTFNFSFSTDGTNFTSVSALNFASPGTADATPAWSSGTNRSTTISANVANNGILFLRWTSTDNVGGGNVRDSLALDNISVTAVPEPGAFLFAGLVCGVFGLKAGGRRLLGKVIKRDAA
jgi:hypothetical protein